MPTSFVTYLGNLRTQMQHVASSSIVQTDAPVDNKGKGELFSPTDLLASALASCAITIMGIAAQTHEIKMDFCEAEVTKQMAANPRRVDQVIVLFKLSILLNQKERQILENAAKTCPVAKSLHPDLLQDMRFEYV